MHDSATETARPIASVDLIIFALADTGLEILLIDATGRILVDYQFNL